MLVGLDQLAEFLGVDDRRELGRADEVTEDDGEVAPLGFDADSERVEEGR